MVIQAPQIQGTRGHRGRDSREHLRFCHVLDLDHDAAFSISLLELHSVHSAITMSLHIPHREKSNGMSGGGTKAVILVSAKSRFPCLRASLWPVNWCHIEMLTECSGRRRLARHPLPPALARRPQGTTPLDWTRHPLLPSRATLISPLLCSPSSMSPATPSSGTA